MDPFLPLRPLPTHVEELKIEILEGKVYFDYPRCFHTCPQNVLLRGLVVLRTQSVKVVQKATEYNKPHL